MYACSCLWLCTLLGREKLCLGLRMIRWCYAGRGFLFSVDVYPNPLYLISKSKRIVPPFCCSCGCPLTCLTTKHKKKHVVSSGAAQTLKLIVFNHRWPCYRSELCLGRVCSRLRVAEFNRMSLHSLTIKCHSVLVNCSIWHLFSRLSQCVTFLASTRSPRAWNRTLGRGQGKVFRRQMSGCAFLDMNVNM